jgi:hypothetical protein
MCLAEFGFILALPPSGRRAASAARTFGLQPAQSCTFAVSGAPGDGNIDVEPLPAFPRRPRK